MSRASVDANFCDLHIFCIYYNCRTFLYPHILKSQYLSIRIFINNFRVIRELLWYSYPGIIKWEIYHFI